MFPTFLFLFNREQAIDNLEFVDIGHESVFAVGCPSTQSAFMY